MAPLQLKGCARTSSISTTTTPSGRQGSEHLLLAPSTSTTGSTRRVSAAARVSSSPAFLASLFFLVLFFASLWHEASPLPGLPLAVPRFPAGRSPYVFGYAFFFAFVFFLAFFHRGVRTCFPAVFSYLLEVSQSKVHRFTVYVAMVSN